MSGSVTFFVKKIIQTPGIFLKNTGQPYGFWKLTDELWNRSHAKL